MKIIIKTLLNLFLVSFYPILSVRWFFKCLELERSESSDFLAIGGLGFIILGALGFCLFYPWPWDHKYSEIATLVAVIVYGLVGLMQGHCSMDMNNRGITLDHVPVIPSTSGQVK